MITIIYQTGRYGPEYALLDLRTSVDGWAADPLPGVYDPAAGGWRWDLDFNRYGAGFLCKFHASPYGWQTGGDLTFAPAPAAAGQFELQDGSTYRFTTEQITFPPPTAPVVDHSWVQSLLFEPRAKAETVYDVIVIGSGMAGGTLADHLADSGLSVLVLEAGGYTFPTHIGNLPRPQAAPGSFSKHIWALWERFKVINYDKPDGSDYVGGQGFNLGGRSVYWGGFIPRLTSWELDRWPTTVKWYLEDIGYLLAEDFMGRSTGPRTLYNRRIHLLLRETFPEMHHADAPVAIRQRLEGANTVPTGVFSTADVLSESLMTNSAAGNGKLEVLLGHQAVEILPDDPVRVRAVDLKHDREVTLQARRVVIAAGCFESARLVKRSPGLPDPEALVGKGASDHPIYFTHFRIPRESPYFEPSGNVKPLSQPKEGEDPARRAPFNLLLELGADLNHGRYMDESLWEEHLRARNDYMLCEMVFLCNEELDEANALTFTGETFRPVAGIRKYTRPDLEAVTEELKWRLLKKLGAQPTTGPAVPIATEEERWRRAFRNLDGDRQGSDFGEGMPGGVAHEVGSLRMRVPAKEATATREAEPARPGLVDENLRYLGTPHENVYVCDLSVFPTTPAANPSLTAVALAIRLAEHLRQDLAP
jgi:choline dehydrogenase-like flavoprotein